MAHSQSDLKSIFTVAERKGSYTFPTSTGWSCVICNEEIRSCPVYQVGSRKQHRALRIPGGGNSPIFLAALCGIISQFRLVIPFIITYNMLFSIESNFVIGRILRPCIDYVLIMNLFYRVHNKIYNMS